MSTKLFYLFIISLSTLIIIGCEKPAEIRVRNSIGGATLQNIRWGDVLLTGRLLPGEASGRIQIYDDPDWGVDLPAEEPIRFYMNVQGDLIFLETRETYRLDEEVKLTVSLSDTTKVWNSVVND